MTIYAPEQNGLVRPSMISIFSDPASELLQTSHGPMMN